MLVLDTVNKSITVAMSGAATTTNPDFVTAYSDDNGTTFVEGSSDGALNGTSQVTLVSAPAASTRRLIKSIYIENKDTSAVTITVTLNSSSTLRTIAKVTLQVGDTWSTDGTTDTNGNIKTVQGAVNLTTGVTGVLPVANGGTGVTASSGATSVVLRDSNQNIVANSISESYSNVAAAGTTTTLTVASGPNYVVTGSGGQTYQLPDATTLPNGVNYTFNNNQSSGTIIVKNNSATTVATVQSGGYVDVILLSNSTAAGSWDVHNFAPSNVSWSTNTFDYPGSITSATWNGSTVLVNRGGTGATTLTGYVIGNGTSAMTASSTIPTTALSGTITNAQLANSTISGISLGSNLANLTAGSGITFSSGTTYNGSTAITMTAGGGVSTGKAIAMAMIFGF